MAAWKGHRQEVAREILAALESVGVDARLTVHGADPLELNLLWVHCPYPTYEASESWLRRLVTLPAPLAVRDLEQCISEGMPDYLVFTGDGGDQEQWAIERRLQRAPSDGPEFGRFSILGGPGRWSLFVNSRGATSVVRALPDVEIRGPRDIEKGHDWVALSATETSEAERLMDMATGLESVGLATCTYEIRSSEPPRTLLTAYAGEDELEQFIDRVVESTRGIHATWATEVVMLARWLIPQIEIHRCWVDDWCMTMERLEAALPDLPCSGSYAPADPDSGVITAPRNRVEQVLDFLEGSQGDSGS